MKKSRTPLLIIILIISLIKCDSKKEKEITKTAPINIPVDSYKNEKTKNTSQINKKKDSLIIINKNKSFVNDKKLIKNCKTIPLGITLSDTIASIPNPRNLRARRTVYKWLKRDNILLIYAQVFDVG